MLGVVIFSGVSLATLFKLSIVPSVYNLVARRTSSPNAIAHELSAMASESEALLGLDLDP